MRILHTVSRYYPHTGGSEEVVRRLSEQLAGFGHDVTVATSQHPDRIAGTLNGVTIRSYHIRGDDSLGMQGNIRAFEHDLLQGGYDIVMNYGVNTWGSDLTMRHLGSLDSATVIVPLGYYQRTDRRYQAYYKRLPEVLGRYDAVVNLSDRGLDSRYAAEHGLTNVRIIPNGADMEEFRSVEKGGFRRSQGIGSECLVLSVSNHSRVKGHDVLWRCADRLRNEPVRFVHIGNPFGSSLTKWLKECYTACRIKARRTGSVRLEATSRRDVVSAFVDADILLVTSTFETAPVVVPEAFVSRTHVISTPVGNIPEYEDMVSIASDEHEMTQTIRRFMKDPDGFASGIDKASGFAAENLSWRSIARSYESLYSGLIAGRN